MKHYLILLVTFSIFFSCINDENNDHQVIHKEVIASFESNITEIFTTQNITFTDTSTGDPTLRKWTFDGGNPETSTDISPNVIYSSPGVYSVTLEVQNESSMDIIVETDYITVIDELVASFESDKNDILITQSITFSDISTGNSTSRIWTFEGGNPEVSTDLSPVVTYANPGIYSVTLEVKNESFEDVIVETGYVMVHEPEFSKGLVAYYPFNGNANDESEYQNHGHVDGPVLDVDRFGEMNSSYSFDGDNDIIAVYDAEHLLIDGGELTLSAWIYPKEIKSQTVFRKGGCHPRGPFNLALSATNDMIFSFANNDGEYFQARKQGYDINTWYLITGVLKDHTMYLYINSVLERTITITGDILYDPAALYIGTRLQLPSSTFNGMIDEIRIYNRALSDSEVLYLYENIE